MRPAIITIDSLVTDQAVTFSAALVVIGSTGANNPLFQFNIAAGKRIFWRLSGIFTLGAAGGFRFNATAPAAPTIYNAVWDIRENTTPAVFGANQLAQADFTNAAAVAADYKVYAYGSVTAAAAGTFALKFAQNAANAATATLRAGLTFELYQY